jgi:hypothetical protein
MWFHSEMNIACTDYALIKDWVGQLWSEHLCISIAEASRLLSSPNEAFDFFKEQAQRNLQAMNDGLLPDGCVYPREGTIFPSRELDGINLTSVIVPERQAGL